MKRRFFALLPSVLAFAAFAADGEAITTPEGLLTSVSTTLTGYLTAAFPIIASLIAAGLGIWAAIKLVGIVKKGFGAGSGR